MSVVIKKESKSLDLADLAFCIMNPAMLRRIMFSAAELNDWSDVYYHYGYPAEASNKGDIYIPASYSGDRESENIVDFVLTELKKLGVDIESNT